VAVAQALLEQMARPQILEQMAALERLVLLQEVQ
jgi:hypothetical protein